MSILDINNRIQSANDRVETYVKWQHADKEYRSSQPGYEIYKFLNQHGMDHTVFKLPRIERNLYIKGKFDIDIEKTDIEAAAGMWFEVYYCMPHGVIYYEKKDLDKFSHMAGVMFDSKEFIINDNIIRLPTKMILENVEQWPEWMYKKGKWQYPFNEFMIVTRNCAKYKQDKNHYKE